ncbi:MAG TPA: hypothetical protein PLS11_14875 [Ottowia sp.]|nr:hypothetical protein [Ottowia sp.]
MAAPASGVAASSLAAGARWRKRCARQRSGTRRALFSSHSGSGSLAHRQVVGAGAGQIEIELDARGQRFARLAVRQVQHLHVVGDLGVVLVVFVVAGAVDAHELAPAQDRLGAEEHHQTILVAGVFGALGAAALGVLLDRIFVPFLLLGACWISVISYGF